MHGLEVGIAGGGVVDVEGVGVSVVRARHGSNGKSGGESGGSGSVLLLPLQMPTGRLLSDQAVFSPILHRASSPDSHGKPSTLTVALTQYWLTEQTLFVELSDMANRNAGIQT